MEAQLEIESKLNKKVILKSESDGVNLLFGVYCGLEKVAHVYKGFDRNFNEVQIVRYFQTY